MTNALISSFTRPSGSTPARMTAREAAEHHGISALPRKNAIMPSIASQSLSPDCG